MSDLFDEKNFPPMLLYETQPFDDEDYIYELKPGGIRCIAYLGDGKVALQNKRYKDVTSLYPELQEMHRCVKRRAVLDGELVVLQDGKPDFYALQKRSPVIRSSAQMNTMSLYQSLLSIVSFIYLGTWIRSGVSCLWADELIFGL